MSSIDSTLIGWFSSHVVEVKARDWIFSVGAGGSLSIDIRLGHSTLFALSAFCKLSSEITFLRLSKLTDRGIVSACLGISVENERLGRGFNPLVVVVAVADEEERHDMLMMGDWEVARF